MLGIVDKRDKHAAWTSKVQADATERPTHAGGYYTAGVGNN